MSSTRRAAPGAPLSQERYMSSPEYAELRGIAANAVTTKALLLSHPAKRSLLFFFQALSIKGPENPAEPGGLKKFAAHFCEMFSDRIGTPTMRRAGVKPGQRYSQETADKIWAELDPSEELLGAMIHNLQPRAHSRMTFAEEFYRECRQRLLKQLPGFITELCINPQMRFAAPGETKAAVDQELIAIEDNIEARTAKAEITYFEDIIGALFDYKRSYEEKARQEFVMTDVARQVFETLDVALATSKMVVLQGDSRIGKSTAAKAWCEQHLGEARFVDLAGILNRTGVFRAIAKAYGLTANGAYTATKLQAKIEDVMQRSKLLVLVDEAHFLLSATERTRCAPELIDWVNTAICNHDVPCALVCTPQLIIRMARHEHRAGWNADQWRGRVKRFSVLPEIPSAKDLRAVARKLLPSGDKETIDYIVGYALSSKLHMPAIANAIDEARQIVARDGRDRITFEDVERAVTHYCAPSAAAMLQAFSRTGKGRPDARPPAPSDARTSSTRSEPLLAPRIVLPAELVGGNTAI
jgi:hypothetical protein